MIWENAKMKEKVKTNIGQFDTKKAAKSAIVGLTSYGLRPIGSEMEARHVKLPNGPRVWQVWLETRRKIGRPRVEKIRLWIDAFREATKTKWWR